MEKKIIEAHMGNMGIDTKESWIEFYRNSFDNHDFKSLKKSLIDYNNSWTRGILYIWFNEMGNTRDFGTSNDAYTFLYYADQMYIPTYLYQHNDGKEIEFSIGKHHYKVEGKATEDDWFFASSICYQIYAAQVLRSKDNLDFYSNMPTATLWEEYDWVNHLDNRRVGLTNIKMLQVFQHLIKVTLSLEIIAETKAFILAEMQTKDPDIDQKLYAKYIQLPLLNIYEQILQNNQEGYEEAVYQALLLWKERYTMQYVDANREDKDSKNDPIGYWAIPIIAACAYAYDKGMAIPNIETGYLSDWMIRGDFSEVKLMVE